MNFRDMDTDGSNGRPAAAAAAMGLARLSSIYSLTLDEFQNTLGGLGKDVGSMNMDEFLKNIWIAEETQAMSSAVPVGFGEAGGGSALQRQGSLTLPRTISLKTVDEVWMDISRDNDGDIGCGHWLNASGNLPSQQQLQQQQQQQQQQYGEMTLEEFLVKAGVVREDVAQCSQAVADGCENNGSGNTNVLFGGFPVASPSNTNAVLGLGFSPASQSNGGGAMMKSGVGKASANLHSDQLQSSHNTFQLISSIEVGSRKGVADGGIGGIGDPVANNGISFGGSGYRVPAAGGSPVSNGDLSSLSPASCVFNKGHGRKSGNIEKAVERRQKRMIKNRESAARSRARKQAYTMELEAEVAKLKEQNQNLMRKQANILEMQRKQMLETLEKKEGSKKQRLRRTQTGPW